MYGRSEFRTRGLIRTWKKWPGRRKFWTQTSNNMNRWKTWGGSSQRRERVRRKKMQVREKVETSWNTVCFPMFCGSGGTKRLAKAAGAEPSERWKSAPHPTVAQSTFGSQNYNKNSCSDHFWMLSSWKSACRCGAKHIWKLRCLKCMKKCTSLWRELIWTFTCEKHPHIWSTFRSWDVEKVHSVVARSRFRNQW